jgi:inosine/xanthosine triphosphate pyrophosphatase family protein
MTIPSGNANKLREVKAILQAGGSTLDVQSRDLDRPLLDISEKASRD